MNCAYRSWRPPRGEADAGGSDAAAKAAGESAAAAVAVSDRIEARDGAGANLK
jgi:hypothetical protein